MARIVGHLSLAALERRYRAARDVTEARHYQVHVQAEEGGILSHDPSPMH